MPWTSLIILKSLLLDSASIQLSGDKNWNNLSSLYAFLQQLKYYGWFLPKKMSKKMCALLNKYSIISWTVNDIEIIQTDSNYRVKTPLVVKTWQKLLKKFFCTVKKSTTNKNTLSLKRKKIFSKIPTDLNFTFIDKELVRFLAKSENIFFAGWKGLTKCCHFCSYWKRNSLFINFSIYVG